MIEKWNPKPIQKYIKKYYSNQNSRDTARIYLKAFFKTMNKDPETYLKSSDKQVQDDLWSYAEKIENRAKKTQAIMLNVIKKYLTRNDKVIKENTYKDILSRNNLLRSIHSTAKRRTPTTSDLKKILSYGGIKAKALFTLCASTGLRIDEAISLTWNDIDLENRMIELEGKGGYKRITFFTEEAKEFLLLWKPEREKNLQRMFKKSKFLRDKLERQGYEIKRIERFKGHYYYHIFKDGKELTKEEIIRLDSRVFPYDYVNAQRIWQRLLDKAGEPYNIVDRNAKLHCHRGMFTIHSLRRFWFTQLSSERASPEYVNYMGGHMSELDLTYKDYDSEIMRRNLKEEYDKHMDCLNIFSTTPQSIIGITGEMEQLKKDKDSMQETIKELRAKNIEKEIFTEHMIKQFQAMQNKIDNLEYQFALEHDQIGFEERDAQAYKKKFPTKEAREKDWKKTYDKMKKQNWTIGIKKKKKVH